MSTKQYFKKNNYFFYQIDFLCQSELVFVLSLFYIIHQESLFVVDLFGAHLGPTGPGPHGLLHTLDLYTPWVPAQNGSLHNMGPYTAWVPTQHGALHKIGPYTM